MTYGTAAPIEAAARPRNVPGLVSLLIGVLAVLFGNGFFLVQSAVIRMSNGIALLGALSAARAVVAVIVGLAGLVLGVIGLVRRDGSGKAAAGAGTAIAAVTLIDVLTTGLYSLIISIRF